MRIKTKTKKSFLFFTLLFAFAPLSSYSEQITLMTYNLENLFDTHHDSGKNDFTYMPLEVKNKSPQVQNYCKTLAGHYKRACLNLDWNEATYRKKVKNMAEVISSVNNIGPDILILQEIENIDVLKTLNEEGNFGYVSEILIEGPDSRGIDTAILSRFPLARAAKAHKVDFEDIRSQGKHAKETRFILEATFQVGKKLLTVFANHWPSQNNIDEARVAAAKTLVEAASKIKDSAIVAAGDFNTLPSDSPNAIKDILLSGSTPSFIDSKEQNPSRFKGTHYFAGQWNELDRIFLYSHSTGANCLQKTCILPDYKTYEVVRPAFVMTTSGSSEQQETRQVPMSFNEKTGDGYSDHLAVKMEFSL